MARNEQNIPQGTVAAARQRYIQNTDTSTYKFPHDLGEHAIVFNFKKYNFSQTGNLTRQVQILPSSSIILPLPRELHDAIQVNTRNEELGMVASSVVSAISSSSGQTVTGGFGSTMGRALGLANAAGGVVGDAFTHRESLNPGVDDATRAGAMIKRMSRGMLGSMLPGAGAAYDAATGGIANPHMSLLFGGTNMKKYTFDWKFAPRNAQESETLNNVIKELKRKSLPSFTKTGIEGNINKFYLNYPHMADVGFLGLADNHYWKFKTCLIESVIVNYAPDSLAIVEGGKPAAIMMTLALSEMVVTTSEDI